MIIEMTKFHPRNHGGRKWYNFFKLLKEKKSIQNSVSSKKIAFINVHETKAFILRWRKSQKIHSQQIYSKQ